MNSTAQKAQKRGGGQAIVSWDDQTAEERYQNEPVENLTPEMLFEKRWAATLLENTLQKLRQEFTLSSRAELFDQLEPHLLGGIGANLRIALPP